MPSDAHTPDWVKDAVFYQIFPDRFASSDQIAKPHNLERWDAPPTVRGFKGGDLLGVAEHLDYLVDLGVTAIYLNPIFQSSANHRYHTHDYLQVDPILGGTAAFQQLLAAAHSRGMFVIIDGVFNHAGRGFLQFNHALENGSASPYLDWFTFNGFPVRAYDGPPNYAAWFNLAELPKLNYRNPQVREFALNVAEHWVRAGIDGWRLDVPEEIDDDDFWREFRRRCKRANPEAYIVGEIWHRADRWLQGDMFDAVMNYQFTRACLAFLLDHSTANLQLAQPQSYGDIGAIDAPAFGQMLTDLLSWYPPQVSYAQLNLLGSHDTARWLTIANGDTSALELGYLVMFTYPGAPMIYYGDEIGLRGGPDPGCRASFPWDRSEWNDALLLITKRYAELRKKYRALRRGDFKTVYAADKTYVFSRTLEGETVVVAVNAGSSTSVFDLPVPDGSHLQEEWTGVETRAYNGVAWNLHIPPREGRVWTVVSS